MPEEYTVSMPTPVNLPENVARRTESRRAWNGVDVIRHEVACTGRLLYKIQRDESLTQLGAQLEEVGRGRIETRSAPHLVNPHHRKPRSLYLAPPQTEIWAHSSDARHIQCVVIRYDADELGERLAMRVAPDLANTPRLQFFDDRVWTLMKLLSEAIDDPDPAAQLYGDSLVAAIGAKLFEVPVRAKGGERGLSAGQLRDALGYLEANMPARVELAQLARLAGLSQSHYSRAFKASTGLAPYQWQLHSRVERAKELLLDTNGGLDEVAVATGFADAVHFGRTFRNMTGATPAAWRTDRQS